MKKIFALLTLVTMLLFGLVGCNLTNIPNTPNNPPPVVENGGSTDEENPPVKEEDVPVEEEDEVPPVVEDKTPPLDNEGILISEDGLYTDKDRVALYILYYEKLPSNYITKSQAGGKNGRDIRKHYTHQNKKSIGGDRFGNREGRLPAKPGRTFIELDIDYKGISRGATRIVYSNDFLVFYTDDHYESFLLFDEVTREWKSYSMDI